MGLKILRTLKATKKTQTIKKSKVINLPAIFFKIILTFLVLEAPNLKVYGLIVVKQLMPKRS